MFEFYYTNRSLTNVYNEPEDSIGGYITTSFVNISDPCAILPEISHFRLNNKRYNAFRCFGVKYTGDDPITAIISINIPITQAGGKLMTGVQFAGVLPNTVNNRLYVNPIENQYQTPPLSFVNTLSVDLIKNQVIGLWLKQIVTPATQTCYEIVGGLPQKIDISQEFAQIVIDY